MARVEAFIAGHGLDEALQRAEAYRNAGKFLDNFAFFAKRFAVADLRGERGTPPGGPNSFNFMQFLGNFGKFVCWRPPPLWGVGAPPRGNPGSATVL